MQKLPLVLEIDRAGLGEVGDLVYFRLHDAQSVLTTEILPGRMFTDHDKYGRLIGVEVIGACDVLQMCRLIADKS